jgi:hypothetical protein
LLKGLGAFWASLRFCGFCVDWRLGSIFME